MRAPSFPMSSLPTPADPPFARKLSRHARMKHLVVPIAALAMLAGCSITPRPTFIEIVPAKAAASGTEARERAVYIRAVNDLRKFALNSSVPAAPSMSTVTQLDPVHTATAVAQIRTAGGTVFADVFLKDGKTVAALIKDATADAFSRAGYRVVESV